jgi:hypothetical protein
MSKVVWSATVAAVLFASASGLNAQKIKREPINPIRDVAGAASYKEYCTQCHGAAGLGDGPVAKLLKVPPSDLTRISQRHEGHFPTGMVRQIVLGDYEVPPHGSRDIPLWGLAFRSVDGSSVAELRLVNLVKYLEGMQKK